MDNTMYAEALKKALTEIKNLSPDIKHSFLLSQDGTIVAEDEGIEEAMTPKVVQSFQGILEKTTMIEGLESYLIEGENGKVFFSRTSDMYLTMITSKNADIASLQTTPRLIIPTILKLFESVTPTPTTKKISDPSVLIKPSKLLVETFSGSEFMKRFSGETVQVDRELLDEWSKSFEGKIVGGVEIETPMGKRAVYKVKPINDSKNKKNGIIRIPEKISRDIVVKNGQTVSVKPVKPSTATQNLTYILRTS